MGCMDPIIPTAVTMLANVVSTLKNASELAKTSTDFDLKVAIGDAYSALIDLKAKISELDDENRELKKQLAQRATLKRDPRTGYYFKEGESDSPICQRCYEGEGKLAYLSNIIREENGLRRSCHQCDRSFWEQKFSSGQSRRPNDPLSWMG